MIITSESFIPSDKIEKNLEFGILVLYKFGFMVGYAVEAM